MPSKNDQHISESPSIHRKGSDTNDDCVEKDITSEKDVKNQGGGQAHEAGYDAYMTGVIFALHAKYLEIGCLLDKC